MTSDSVFHFNLVAEAWSRTAVPDAAVVDASLDAACMPAGACVLDAGCGPGLLLPFLLERVGPTGRIVALDSARRMLAIAARRHGEARIRFVCSDLSAYDGLGGPFDTIVCCRFLHHMPDPLLSARKMAGWMRPEGRLLIMHELDGSDPPAAQKNVGDLQRMLAGASLALDQELSVGNWVIMTGKKPAVR
jgi:2-polyprenyl-3-methyl-5-hydroxy-6-metoxy-1,4-benzoquinol methylase